MRKNDDFIRATYQAAYVPLPISTLHKFQKKDARPFVRPNKIRDIEQPMNMIARDAALFGTKLGGEARIAQVTRVTQDMLRSANAASSNLGILAPLNLRESALVEDLHSTSLKAMAVSKTRRRRIDDNAAIYDEDQIDPRGINTQFADVQERLYRKNTMEEDVDALFAGSKRQIEEYYDPLLVSKSTLRSSMMVKSTGPLLVKKKHPRAVGAVARSATERSGMTPQQLGPVLPPGSAAGSSASTSAGSLETINSSLFSSSQSSSEASTMASGSTSRSSGQYADAGSAMASSTRAPSPTNESLYTFSGGSFVPAETFVDDGQAATSAAAAQAPAAAAQAPAAAAQAPAAAAQAPAAAPAAAASSADPTRNAQTGDVEFSFAPTEMQERMARLQVESTLKEQALQADLAEAIRLQDLAQRQLQMAAAEAEVVRRDRDAARMRAVETTEQMERRMREDSAALQGANRERAVEREEMLAQQTALREQAEDADQRAGISSDESTRLRRMAEQRLNMANSARAERDAERVVMQASIEAAERVMAQNVTEAARIREMAQQEIVELKQQTAREINAAAEQMRIQGETAVGLERQGRMRDRELADAALANASADRELLRSRAEETFNRYELARQGTESAIVASQEEQTNLTQEAVMLRDLLQLQSDAIQSKNQTIEGLSGIIEINKANADDAMAFERSTQRDKEMLEQLKRGNAERRGLNQLLQPARRTAGAGSSGTALRMVADTGLSALMRTADATDTDDPYEFKKQKRGR